MIDVLSVISPIINARNQQAQLAENARQFNLGQRQQSQQFGVTSGLEKSKLDEMSRQFGITSDLDKQKLAETVRQYNMGYGLDKAKLDEMARQFGITSNLDKAKLEESIRQFGLTFPESQRQFDINTGLNQQRIGIDYGQLANQWLSSLLGTLR